MLRELQNMMLQLIQVLNVQVSEVEELRNILVILRNIVIYNFQLKRMTTETDPDVSAAPFRRAFARN